MEWIKRIGLIVMVSVICAGAFLFLKPALIFLAVWLGVGFLAFLVWAILYGVGKRKEKAKNRERLKKALNVLLWIWAWWLYLINSDIFIRLKLK